MLKTEFDQFAKTALRQQLYGRKGLDCVKWSTYFVPCFFSQIPRQIMGKRAHQALSIAESKDAVGVSNQNKIKIAECPTVHT